MFRIRHKEAVKKRILDMTRFLPTVAAIGAAIVSAGVFTTPALADTLVTKPVTLSYDIVKLGSTGAVHDVLNQLERQARDACTTIKPVLRTETIDQDCVQDVMVQAVSGIDNAALTEVFQLSDTYQSIALSKEQEAQG